MRIGRLPSSDFAQLAETLQPQATLPFFVLLFPSPFELLLLVNTSAMSHHEQEHSPLAVREQYSLVSGSVKNWNVRSIAIEVVFGLICGAIGLYRAYRDGGFRTRRWRSLATNRPMRLQRLSGWHGGLEGWLEAGWCIPSFW